jgi:hypothetical protein
MRDQSVSCRASDQSDIASGTGFIFSLQLYLFGLYFLQNVWSVSISVPE